jgi:hypothetical protein
MSQSKFSLFVLLVDAIFFKTESGRNVVLDEVYSGDKTEMSRDAGFTTAVLKLALQSQSLQPDRVNLFRAKPGDYPALEDYVRQLFDTAQAKGRGTSLLIDGAKLLVDHIFARKLQGFPDNIILRLENAVGFIGGDRYAARLPGKTIGFLGAAAVLGTPKIIEVAKKRVQIVWSGLVTEENRSCVDRVCQEVENVGAFLRQTTQNLQLPLKYYQSHMLCDDAAIAIQKYKAARDDLCAASFPRTESIGQAQERGYVQQFNLFFEDVFHYMTNLRITTQQPAAAAFE